MTGHEDIIAMRRAGRRPGSVWITDSDDEYSRRTARDWRHHRAVNGHQAAHIRLTAEDIPGALDLRCLRGLQVHISTDRGPARFDQLLEACRKADSRAVAGLKGGVVVRWVRDDEKNAYSPDFSNPKDRSADHG